MASQWFTTLEESRAQFGGYHVNPEKPTERVLSRVFHGISKAAFPSIRAEIDSTPEMTNPLVDNQVYEGTWRIKDVRTQDGQGDLAGSLTVTQDIANELNDGPGPDNEYLTGLQSDAFELTEYAWMKYTHYLKRTTKKWTHLTQDAAEESADTLGKIEQESSSSSPAPQDIVLTITGGTWKSTPPSTTNYSVTSTWGSKDWNKIIRYVYTGILGETVKYYIYDQASDPYDITPVSVGGVVVGYDDGYGNLQSYKVTLTPREIDQPHIESIRMQEESDRSFTLYRTISELTYPAIMREIYLQYAGMTKTSELPVDGTNTIKLTGFLNETEEIYKNARFRIGGDVYTVTADATCVAGAVTLAVTPTVTLATSEAHLADVSNAGARAFFNAIG